MEKMEVGKNEERRRRIIERGTDRMALITGRVKTLSVDGDSISGFLPSSPAASSLLVAPPHHAHTQSTPGLFFQHHPISQPNIHVDQYGKHEASTKDDISYGFTRKNSFDLGTRVEPQLHKYEASPSVARDIPKSSSGIHPILKQCGIDLSSFNPKEINACIIASENTRVLCSIVIALLVVLSNISLPRSIIKSKSVIASKPLYVLLMTDVAIVIARLVLWKQAGVKEKVKEEKNELDGSLKDEQSSWDGAVKVLELGLVLHQTLRAIFIDCSFYMVIVICGLCLL